MRPILWWDDALAQALGLYVTTGVKHRIRGVLGADGFWAWRLEALVEVCS